MARPRMPKALRRCHNILLVLKPHEREALEAGADERGLDMNSYLRALIAADQTGPRTSTRPGDEQ